MVWSVAMPVPSVVATVTVAVPPFSRMVVGATVKVTCSAGTTLMANSSLIDAPPSSLAVTFTGTVPVSPAIGMPEKVRVSASKDSHVGSVELSVLAAA